MDKPPLENSYLQQVLEEQEEVDRQLRKSRPRLPAPAAPGAIMGAMATMPGDIHSARTVDYRITGFWLWQSVVVPPNVYVVHTRKGHSEPIHLGMGISFSFNPLNDAFLLIPSAVQTILINANCICRERQGLLVQAYVQWIIQDLRTAYWKLDFSDPEDPMGIVNLQLREQAEAAIKDKVATMSIDEVLSDKQPIIEELTYRLRTVAEGNQDHEAAAGLGLKIVTVQIKDAVVSSARVWQNLQAPFRAEREKLARLAELANNQEINQRERENRINSETAELNAASDLDRLRADKERLKYDRERDERLRRQQLEQEAQRQTIAEENRTAQIRNEAQLALNLQELDLEKQRLVAEMAKIEQQMQLEAVAFQQQQAELTAMLERENLQNLAQIRQTERELALEEKRHEIANNLSIYYLQNQLITQLPEIAQHLPVPQEQRTTIITGENQEGTMKGLLSFVASALQLLQGVIPQNQSSIESNRETRLED